MNASDPNVALVDLVAEYLGEDLIKELVFVGGAVAGLLITDPATPAIRPTQDVDVICSTLALGDYYSLGALLKARGFHEDQRTGAPVCRWRIGDLAVDVMPTRSEILGFSNRWYPLALESAMPIVLPSLRRIRVVTAPVFVATKLEAFDGRGNRDYLSSHDLEDLIAVVDGRETLLEECRASPSELKIWLGARMAALLNIPAFVDALSGHLPADAANQRRLSGLKRKLQDISELKT